MFESLLHKLPDAVHLPCSDDEILWLLLLQHQPHSLAETERETGSDHRDITQTDSARLDPDRQEVNLRPPSGALTCTSVLTSQRGLVGRTLWENRTVVPQARRASAATHKNAHVAMKAHAGKLRGSNSLR